MREFLLQRRSIAIQFLRRLPARSRKWRDLYRVRGAGSCQGTANAREHAGDLQFSKRRRHHAPTIGASGAHEDMIEIAKHALASSLLRRAGKRLTAYRKCGDDARDCEGELMGRLALCDDMPLSRGFRSRLRPRKAANGNRRLSLEGQLTSAPRRADFQIGPEADKVELHIPCAARPSAPNDRRAPAC